MANKLKGEVGVKTEGGEIVFRPTFESICAAEEKCGASMMQMVDKHDQGSMTVKDQVALLGYFSEAKDIGQRLFDAGGLNLIRMTLYQVLTVCVAGGKDAKKNTETPARQKKSTGETSPK